MDAPPRLHRIVNPEHCAAILRRIVEAWDTDRPELFVDAVGDARRLLGVAPPPLPPLEDGD